MTTMRAAQISRPGGDFELVERDIPVPREGQVRVKVEACGICHGDSVVKEGLMPGIPYPRVPGHEIAGRLDDIGPGVQGWQVGQRVGLGWHGGHCFTCAPCRQGDFVNCAQGRITGISSDGGYAEYVVAAQEAVALIPDELDAVTAAPLVCAGLTTFNALRHSVARPGDLVAIQGVGGLGHMAIQYARRMGFQTVAISGGPEKEALARQLGAHHYIDAGAADLVAELQRLGGATVILATAPSAAAMAAAVNGLGPNGQLMVVAASEPLAISPFSLIGGKHSVTGWNAGHAKDSEDTLNFSVLTGVRPMVETFPLDRVAEAYAHMMTNKARFRVVLTMDAV